MANTLSIPLEILLMILDELPKSSLFSFGQTCKGAWAAVEPLLYRSITFEFMKRESGMLPLPEHPIHFFFRAIRQRPARASYVKAATFTTYPSSRWETEDLVHYPAPPDIRPLWLERLDTLGRDQTPWDRRFRHDVDAGNPSALMAILLFFLSELETLVADVAIRNDLSWDIEGFEFPQLDVVCLPRLEHLSTVFTRTDDESVAHANLQFLRTLKLTDHLSTSATKELLAKTPKLERLSYFLIENTQHLVLGNEESAHRDEWSAFATSLAGVAGTLRILKICIDDTPASYSEDVYGNEWVLNISTRRGAIGSLMHLHYLTKLEIPMHILFGYRRHGVRLRDILPPSLRKLYLRDDSVDAHDLNQGSPKIVIPALQSYLLEPESEPESEPDSKALSLQELHFKLRTVNTTWRSRQFDVQHGRQIYPLRRLESIARQAGLRCTVRFRVPHTSFLSPEHECMDEVDEMVLYDPNAVFPAGGTTETAMDLTRYPTRRRLKKAGCFFCWSDAPLSSWGT